MKKIILSTLLLTVLLFLLSGLAQLLPWGIPTTQKVSAQIENHPNQPEVTDLIQRLPNELTTDQFEEQFLGRISTYSTDNSFSWIITQPLEKDYGNYFIKEVITQFVVALLLSILLSLTISLEIKTRLAIIFIAAIATSTGTYGQLMNWWSMPAAYGLGVSVNLVLSWTLVGFVSAKFILKPPNALK